MRRHSRNFASGPSRHPDRGWIRGRASSRRYSSGYQAGEHHGCRERRRSQTYGLRYCALERSRRINKAHTSGHDYGYTRVYGAGTDRRSRDKRKNRHLCLRNRSLRNAKQEGAVYRTDAGGDLDEASKGDSGST